MKKRDNKPYVFLALESPEVALHHDVKAPWEEAKSIARPQNSILESLHRVRSPLPLLVVLESDVEFSWY